MRFKEDYMKNAQKGEKGFVMISSYMMLAMIMTLSFAMAARSNVFIQNSERNQSRILAFDMAEAGVDYAMNQLASNPEYTGAEYTDLSTDTASGGYEVTITTPQDNANIRMIQTTGYSPGNDSNERGYSARSITAYVQMNEQNYFDSAIFASESITLSGNAMIDSYNSSEGDYSEDSASSNGNIGTNSTSSGGISLSGNSVVNGNAAFGPGGDENSVVSISGNAELNGDADAAGAERADEVQTTGVASSGSVSIAGSTTLTLSTGTYHYSSISITGNAKIRVTGAVTIYVDGDIHIAGNGVSNTTSDPTNCLIFSSGDSVSISGNGSFYGAIHAPEADVQNTGNGEIFGAIVAETYTQTGNGNLHYDEALEDVGGSGVQSLSQVAWNENATSAWTAS